MKPLFAQLFLATSATLALAAPVTDQIPLGNPDLAPTKSRESTAPGLKAPFVVKGSSPSVSASESADKKTAWNLFWTSLRKEKGTPESCFCAGGSVCCHAVHGLSCNYGVCGI